MHQANEHIINVALQVTREVDIRAEDGLGADIAETSRVSLRHRTPQEDNVPLFRDEDPPFVAVGLEVDAPLVIEGTEGNKDADENGNDNANFSLRYSLVTDRNVTANYAFLHRMHSFRIHSFILSYILCVHGIPPYYSLPSVTPSSQSDPAPQAQHLSHLGSCSLS
jgi:hypothetical protein